MAFAPCGLISLTTDFGLQDPFVGCVKAVIAARDPTLKVIDLTHGVAPQDVLEGAFWLSRSFGFFPEGTVHVAVVDPGVGSDRRLLACSAEGHLLVAPDNGLLAPFFDLDGAEIRRLSADTVAARGLTSQSNTFHGRDIFAPVAADLASGALQFSRAGPICADPAPGTLERPLLSPGQVQGRVVTVDRFGNLLTNIDAGLVGDTRRLKALAAELEIPFVRTYSDAQTGDLVALINAFGVVELARVNDRADDITGLGRGAVVQVCRADD